MSDDILNGQTNDRSEHLSTHWVTPLDTAVIWNESEIAKLLIRYNAQFNVLRKGSTQYRFKYSEKARLLEKLVRKEAHREKEKATEDVHNGARTEKIDQETQELIALQNQAELLQELEEEEDRKANKAKKKREKRKRNKIKRELAQEVEKSQNECQTVECENLDEFKSNSETSPINEQEEPKDNTEIVENKPHHVHPPKTKARFEKRSTGSYETKKLVFSDKNSQIEHPKSQTTPSYDLSSTKMRPQTHSEMSRHKRDTQRKEFVSKSPSKSYTDAQYRGKSHTEYESQVKSRYEHKKLAWSVVKQDKKKETKEETKETKETKEESNIAIESTSAVHSSPKDDLQALTAQVTHSMKYNESIVAEEKIESNEPPTNESPIKLAPSLPTNSVPTPQSIEISSNTASNFYSQMHNSPTLQASTHFSTQMHVSPSLEREKSTTDAVMTAHTVKSTQKTNYPTPVQLLVKQKQRSSYEAPKESYTQYRPQLNKSWIRFDATAAYHAITRKQEYREKNIAIVPELSVPGSPIVIKVSGLAI